MDLEVLRTFREVARRGSITATAQALGYTQSGVSRQIAALERAFGVRLFDRATRGVRLTAHGRCLMPHVEASLARLDHARDELARLSRLERGHIRIGAFPTAVAALVPRAIASFRAAHPGVSVSLVEGTTRRLLARLDEDEADVAVVSAFASSRPDPAQFALVRLLDDTMLIAVPHGHRLAGRRRVRLSELAAENWIGAAATDDDAILGPARLPGRARESPVAFAAREWTGKLGLVAAGLGITLVPSLAAQGTRGDVSLLRLSRREAPPRQVYAATRKGASRSPGVDAFITVLRRSAQGLTS